MSNSQSTKNRLFDNKNKANEVKYTHGIQHNSQYFKDLKLTKKAKKPV